MKRILVAIVVLLAPFFGLGAAHTLASEKAANQTCDPSRTEALQANRIIANTQSYKKDNPAEYA